MTTGLPVIIDTDFFSDVGDVGAVTIACAYHRLGHINILGFVCDIASDYIPGGVDVIRSYHGLSASIPIGIDRSKTLDTSHSAANPPGYLYTNFSHPNIGLSATAQDAVTLYRTVLASAAANSVVIIGIGYLTCLSNLLNSAADGISSLTGVQLVSAKVKRLVQMGGTYPNSGAGQEFNFKGDPTATANVFTTWPATVPIISIGSENASPGSGPLDGTSLQTAVPTSNPTRMAFHNAGWDAGNAAWDEMTTMFACEGGTKVGGSGWTTVRGTNAINATTGANTFTASSTGPHYYAVKTGTRAFYEARINDLVNSAAAGGPPITRWSSEAFAGVQLG